MNGKVTIYDIAKTAGVSPATVSRMIHQPGVVTKKTRDKILKAFEFHEISPEDLGTKKRSSTASSIKKASQESIILVCIPTWNNPFYDDILEGIKDFLSHAHCHMVVTLEIPERSTITSFLNYCANLQISGIIVMYALSEDVLRQLNAAYPVVQCSEYNPFLTNIPYVSIDDYSITKIAIAHLINEGCKKIAFFSSSYDYRHVQSRYRAYRSMLTGNGLAVRPEYVVQVADFSYSRILAAANHFFQLADPPDAIFATSDKHAHAVIKAGQALGFRIPEDIKVFGFDNTMYASLSTPTISTISQPRREIGMQSAKLLLTLIQNPYAQVKPILLPSKLVIQEST